MNRRRLISILGAGTITSVAGCSSNNQSGGVEIDESQDNSGDPPETRSEEDFEERLKERMIRDGKRIKGHNLYISDIMGFSDESVTIESNVTINPVNDYALKLHYVPLADVSGSWELVNPGIEQYYNDSSPVEVYYDEGDESWVTSDDPSWEMRYEYQIKDSDFENVVSERTVPADAFGNPDQHIGSVNETLGSDFTLREGGNPVEIRFDLEETPEMYEPFVLALSWEDSETHSSRSGEIVTNSQPIIRVGSDEYEFGELTDDDLPFVSSWMNRDEKSVTETVESGGEKTVNIVRLSNSGRFSERLNSFVSEKKDRNIGRNDFVISSRGTNTMGDSPVTSSVDMPWSVSLTISDEEFDEAVSHAESLTGSIDDSEDIYEMMSDERVVNHRVIQTVASQIHEAGEMMGITEPMGKLRLVCDITQKYEYRNREDGNATLSHPVEVLVNGYADCKDCSLLAYSILSQEGFDMEPDIPLLFGITDYNNSVDGVLGHSSIGISKSKLEVNGSLYENDVLNEEFGESGFENRVEATYTYNNEEYVYAELISPHPIKSVFEPWYDDVDGEIISIHDFG